MSRQNELPKQYPYMFDIICLSSTYIISPNLCVVLLQYPHINTCLYSYTGQIWGKIYRLQEIHCGWNWDDTTPQEHREMPWVLTTHTSPPETKRKHVNGLFFCGSSSNKQRQDYSTTGKRMRTWQVGTALYKCTYLNVYRYQNNQQLARLVCVFSTGGELM